MLNIFWKSSAHIFYCEADIYCLCFYINIHNPGRIQSLWKHAIVRAYVKLAFLGSDVPMEVISIFIFVYSFSILNKELTSLSTQALMPTLEVMMTMRVWDLSND